MKTFLICFILLAATTTVSAEPPDDTMTSKLMIGSWTCQKEETSPEGGFTFYSNGTFISYGVFVFGEQQIRIDVEGTWEVQNGVLIEQIKKSSHPDLVPVGLITRDTLLEVTNKVYRYKAEDGDVVHRMRAVATKNARP